MKDSKYLSKPTQKQSTYLILLISIATWAIYILYNIKRVFYFQIIEMFSITNEEFGILLSICALACTLSYLPGGFLGDKVPIRYLTSISLGCSGLILLWIAIGPSYTMLKIAFFLYGTTTGLLFWPCSYKLIRLSGKNDHDYNRNIGWSYCFSNLIATVVTPLLVIITQITQTEFQSFFFSCALINFFISGLCLFTIPRFDNELPPQKSNLTVFFKQSFILFRNPCIYWGAATLFFIYSIYTLQYLIPIYLKSTFGASLSFITLYGIIQSYGIKIFSTPTIGHLAHHFKTSIVIVGIAVIAVIFSLTLAVLPQEKSGLFIVTILTLLLYFLITGSYAISSDLLLEAYIMKTQFASAVGIFSLVGFLPDIIYPPLFGYLLDHYQNYVYGYTNSILVFFSVMTIISILQFRKCLQTKRSRRSTFIFK